MSSPTLVIGLPILAMVLGGGLVMLIMLIQYWWSEPINSNKEHIDRIAALEEQLGKATAELEFERALRHADDVVWRNKYHQLEQGMPKKIPRFIAVKDDNVPYLLRPQAPDQRHFTDSIDIDPAC